MVDATGLRCVCGLRLAAWLLMHCAWLRVNSLMVGEVRGKSGRTCQELATIPCEALGVVSLEEQKKKSHLASTREQWRLEQK